MGEGVGVPLWSEHHSPSGQKMCLTGRATISYAGYHVLAGFGDEWLRLIWRTFTLADTLAFWLISRPKGRPELRLHDGAQLVLVEFEPSLNVTTLFTFDFTFTLDTFAGGGGTL